MTRSERIAELRERQQDFYAAIVRAKDAERAARIEFERACAELESLGLRCELPGE